MLTATPHAADLLARPVTEFTATCDATLARAKAAVAELKALSPGHDAKVLALYDEVTSLMANMGARASLAKEVHPEEKFREACEQCEQQLEAFNVELSLDRALYDALARVDQASLDPVGAFWLFKTLREFRRSGVDRDAATREKVKALNEELVKIGQAFGRNIRDDVRSVTCDPSELDGLPADWLAAHPAKDGKVTVTTNTPDYLPVMIYAKSAHVREQLWRAYRTRAFPQNVEVLNALLAKRHELATLLGYETWAAYVTETKMVKSAKAAADFIERGRQATLTRAQADMDMLLARKKKDAPGATTVEPWEHQFYEDRVKAESFGLDSQALRTYFEYGHVKRGVMDITSRLFGVRYVAVTDAKTWHPDVETWDLFDEGNALLGRIHLDMHPREGKYKHAAQFGLTVGRAGKELPEAVLVCNFPRTGELLQHSDVETFFHEFGHLLHEIFAGRQPWAGVSGIRTEWDFVEVPSMLLQEWPLDGDALKTFARHHQTGAPIPDALVEQLKRAKEFGVGVDTRRQFFLSAVSLAFHDRAPGFDTSALLKETQDKFLPIRREWSPGTHFELGFGHLDGYSAIYYTYQWSTVIAKDLLTQFRAGGMLDGAVATRYRKKVLEPGGSREAGALVQEFLGRPYSFDAFQQWLDGK